MKYVAATGGTKTPETGGPATSHSIITPLSKIIGHINFLLLRLLRLREYIKVEYYVVENMLDRI